MTYYRVIPSPWFSGRYMVQVWRWWLPLWLEAIDGVSQDVAAEFIKGHSTYYDGAE